MIYMVYVQEKTLPTKKHYTRALANNEAERLAKMYLGETIYILETVASLKAVVKEYTIEHHSMRLQ